MDGDTQSEVVAANGSRLLILEIRQDGLTPRRYEKGMSLPRATTIRGAFDTGDRISALKVNDLNSDGNRKSSPPPSPDMSIALMVTENCATCTTPALPFAVWQSAVGTDGQALIAVSLEDRRVVVLNGALDPVGQTKLNHSAHWLSVQTGRILCVTPRSVGVVLLKAEE